jgi:hypothetical protein
MVGPFPESLLAIEGKILRPSPRHVARLRRCMRSLPPAETAQLLAHTEVARAIGKVDRALVAC